jgi:cytidyltransferase-like protein
MKIVLVTGGFDPVHSGHIAYITAARALGDQLIVGLNSDAWLERKKGRAFMPMEERRAVVGNLRDVSCTITFNDSDGSAKDAIRQVQAAYPHDQIIFANGGDRAPDNIPEMVCEGVEFAFGVGGEHKANSSSWILQEWKMPKTPRSWGHYRVLYEVPGMKVKELTVLPGQSLSMQKHFKRSEYWIVSEGQCVLNTVLESGPNWHTLPVLKITKHNSHIIPVGEWHQLTNPFDLPCKIVEIQYGSECIEEDIERK